MTRLENDEIVDLAEQEKWEEVVKALEANTLTINKSRNIERPNEKKKQEGNSFDSPSLKYLGKLKLRSVENNFEARLSCNFSAQAAKTK